LTPFGVDLSIIELQFIFYKKQHGWDLYWYNTKNKYNTYIVHDNDKKKKFKYLDFIPYNIIWMLLQLI
jgi:hypothetical protein